MYRRRPMNAYSQQLQVEPRPNHMDPPCGTSIIRMTLKGMQLQSTARKCHGTIVQSLVIMITQFPQRTFTHQIVSSSTEEVFSVSNILECVNILLLQSAGQHRRLCSAELFSFKTSAFSGLPLIVLTSVW